MADRLRVATRKGLFTYERNGGGWRADSPAFLGDPVTMILDDAAGRTYAALAHGHFGVKLHRSDDGGEQWDELPVPAYPEAEADCPPDPGGTEPGGADVSGADPQRDEPAKLRMIWSLETGGADLPDRLWCGTLPGGLFRSDDAGASWELVQSLWDLPERKLWFGGGYDVPGIHSIMVDPRDSRHVTVAVSCGGVWETFDDAETWTPCCQGMTCRYLPPEHAGKPEAQDAHRVVRCPGAPDVFWCQHHDTVFRSVDGCRSWREVPNVTPSVFGFAVAVHPTDPDTAWTVPAVKDELRVPVDGRVVVSRTRDGGRSWQVLDQGLPEPPAWDLIYRHGLDIDAGGERLAMGSTTGGLWLSDNGGDTWQTLSAHLPPIYAVRWG